MRTDAPKDTPTHLLANPEQYISRVGRIIRKISADPQILLIVTGFFTAFSLNRFIYHYSEMPWLSVFMFFTLQFYDLTLSGIRQIMAIAILLYAYDFLVKRKLIYFIITVLLAYTMHTSTIMFLLLYLITGKQRTKNFYLISGFSAIGVFVFFPYLLSILNMIFPQYIKYFTEEGSSLRPLSSQ